MLEQGSPGPEVIKRQEILSTWCKVVQRKLLHLKSDTQSLKADGTWFGTKVGVVRILYQPILVDSGGLRQ